MHPFKRTDRVNESLRETISLCVLRNIKDPLLSTVTIISADVSPDLQSARIYFSVLNRNEVPAEEFEKKMNRAAGKIRHHIGKALILKRTPKLTFHFDDSLDAIDRIEGLLKKADEDE